MEVEVTTKPWESVFEGSTEILSGPRDLDTALALAIEATPGEEEEIEDEDQPEIDADIEINAEIVEDVHVVTSTPARITPDTSEPPLSVDLSPLAEI